MAFLCVPPSPRARLPGLSTFWDITGNIPRTRARPCLPQAPAGSGSQQQRGLKPKAWGQSQDQRVCGETAPFPGGPGPTRVLKGLLWPILSLKSEINDTDPQCLASFEDRMGMRQGLSPGSCLPGPQATLGPLLSFTGTLLAIGFLALVLRQRFSFSVVFPLGTSGKVWRFSILTESGAGATTGT